MSSIRSSFLYQGTYLFLPSKSLLFEFSFIFIPEMAAGSWWGWGEMKDILLHHMRKFTSGFGRRAAHTSSAIYLKIVEVQNQCCALHTEIKDSIFAANALKSNMVRDDPKSHVHPKSQTFTLIHH